MNYQVIQILQPQLVSRFLIERSSFLKQQQEQMIIMNNNILVLLSKNFITTRHIDNLQQIDEWSSQAMQLNKMYQITQNLILITLQKSTKIIELQITEEGKINEIQIFVDEFDVKFTHIQVLDQDETNNQNYSQINIMASFYQEGKSHLQMFQLDLATNSIWKTLAFELQKVDKINLFKYFEKEGIIIVTNSSTQLYLFKINLRSESIKLLKILKNGHLGKITALEAQKMTDDTWYIATGCARKLVSLWILKTQFEELEQQQDQNNVQESSAMQTVTDNELSQSNRFSVDMSLCHSRSFSSIGSQVEDLMTQSQILRCSGVQQPQQRKKTKQTIQLVFQINKMRGKITNLIIDNQYYLLLIGDNTGYVYIYDLIEKIQVQAFSTNYKSMLSMKLDNGVLIVTGQDKCIRKYELYIPNQHTSNYSIQ